VADQAHLGGKCVDAGAEIPTGGTWESRVAPSGLEPLPPASPALAVRSEFGPLLINGFPRRAMVQQWTRAEHAIFSAVQAVEMAGCDPRLTEAVILLGRARDLVADVHEGVPMRIAEPAPATPVVRHPLTGTPITQENVDALCARLDEYETEDWTDTERVNWLDANMEGFLPPHRPGEMCLSLFVPDPRTHAGDRGPWPLRASIDAARAKPLAVPDATGEPGVRDA
jgi:hypothetical protein